MALRQLKEKYHKAGLRMVAPAKIKVSQRQRLPPTILSYTQTKTNTKTSNPLPKQIIVEPQTKTNNPIEPYKHSSGKSKKERRRASTSSQENETNSFTSYTSSSLLFQYTQSHEL